MRVVMTGADSFLGWHTRVRMRALTDRIEFHKPLGFLDYNNSQLHDRYVLSDSGPVAEESHIRGFRAVTLRDAIERPEALYSGTIMMTGLYLQNVLEGIGHAAGTTLLPADEPREFRVGNCSTRVVNFILSTYLRQGAWTGLRIPSAVENAPSLSGVPR
jgi:UDP-N-acetylglucosamine 2-epimerase